MSKKVTREQCTARTARGERCKLPAALGVTLCATHAGVARVGRKTKLTRQTADRILAILRAGGYDETACAAAGISRQCFWDWLRRGAAGEAPYNVFADEVQRARAEGESRNVMLIASAAQNNWQAAAWLLERRHPERWARPSQRGEAPAENAPVVTDDPFAEVDELAHRRRRGIGA